jgi:hypothetical protein
MTWWFVVLGLSTLVIVFVAIALYIRIRSHMIAADAARHRVMDHIEADRQSDKI